MFSNRFSGISSSRIICPADDVSPVNREDVVVSDLKIMRSKVLTEASDTFSAMTVPTMRQDQDGMIRVEMRVLDRGQVQLNNILIHRILSEERNNDIV